MTFKIESPKDYEVGSVIEIDSVSGGKEKLKVLSKVRKDNSWLYEVEFIVPEDFEQEEEDIPSYIGQKEDMD